MKLVTKQLEELEAAPYNPRSISDPALAGLAASIRRFGLVQPVVWNQRTGRVVSGHQRLRVLRSEGVTETDVVVVDLPELEEKALNVSQNNPAIAGEFTDQLQGLLAELAEASPMSFEELRLAELLEPAAAPPEPPPDIDDVPAVPKVPVTKPGDVWTLGRHTLVCGKSDGPVPAAVVAATPVLHIVDPPFDLEYEAWSIPDSVTALYVWHRGKTGLRWIASLLGEWGAHELVFTGQARGWARPEQPCLVHESVFVLRRGGHYTLDGEVVAKSGCRVTSDGRHFSVHEHSMGRRNDMPWAKSVYSMEMAMVYSPPGSTVYDPCAGSGSALLAAERHGRRFVGYEMKPEWCDVIVERWQTLTGGQATRT